MLDGASEVPGRGQAREGAGRPWGKADNGGAVMGGKVQEDPTRVYGNRSGRAIIVDGYGSTTRTLRSRMVRRLTRLDPIDGEARLATQNGRAASGFITAIFRPTAGSTRRTAACALTTIPRVQRAGLVRPRRQGGRRRLHECQIG